VNVARLPPRRGLGARLLAILGAGDTSQATWDAAEEALVAADVGPSLAADLVSAARARVSTGAPNGSRDALASVIRERLVAAGCGPFEPGPDPVVILLVGANGTGKTSTAAKLAGLLVAQGRRVVLGAADTYRAAAVEQLRLLGDRVGVPVISQRPGADPGAVAFDAVAAAEARGAGVVIVDSAGRLHTRVQLMAELSKVRRVIERRMPGQPRHVLLVVDAVTGQNGLAQAETFAAEVGVTGIVLTKLDGTARGGIALAVADRLRLPIVLVGIGEGIDQIAPFDPAAYADWLVGK